MSTMPIDSAGIKKTETGGRSSLCHKLTDRREGRACYRGIDARVDAKRVRILPRHGRGKHHRERHRAYYFLARRELHYLIPAAATDYFMRARVG